MTPPDRAPEPLSAEEEAARALAESRPKNHHGQLCPVWTQRLKKIRHAVTIVACDCWILRDARADAHLVLDAARDPRPVGEGLREALADAVALAGMLTDEAEARGLIPYYTKIARVALPELRAALQAGPAAVRPVEPSKPPFNSFETGEGIRGYDFDEVNEWWAVRPVERELDEIAGLARAALATISALLDSTSEADDSMPLFDLINPEWGDELREFLTHGDAVLSEYGYARLSTAQPASTEAGE